VAGPTGWASVKVKTGEGIDAPEGFFTHAGPVAGTGLELSIVASALPCVADGVFTRSLFAGPSVALCRRHLASGVARAIVTVSKNANVATGAQGEAAAAEVAALAARLVGAKPEEVLVASTGVIGKPYPMEAIRAHFAGLALPGTAMGAAMSAAATGTATAGATFAADLLAVARAIMTTDRVPKLASARCGRSTVAGVAKGSGMIEPNMATLLAYIVTDAAVEREALAGMLRRAVDETFNSLSIDTDTSTSDSVIVLANGVAGRVGEAELEAALYAVCRSLTLQLAADGEGATRVIQVVVSQARDPAQAKRVAKSVVNSPLLKCAVHGADPNWGRVVMAVGKCWQDADISPGSVRVSFGGQEVYPCLPDEEGLAEVARAMREPLVRIGVALGTGEAEATVWGCDLSAEYVRINAEYTT
jgi:glutamate N-acetyltransferase/amino-acid N-acetyltransferase